MMKLSTRTKVSIARLCSTVLMRSFGLFGVESRGFGCTRQGIRWELDLNEGIDLSVWLLGAFEPRTLNQIAPYLKKAKTVVDVGANIGTFTLPAAALLDDQSVVFSVEPTEYAHGKLLRNIALNPQLAGKIHVRQEFLCSEEVTQVPTEIYSSWELSSAEQKNPIHLGILKKTTGAKANTLDALARELGLSKIDLIKIDVDGYELDVLKGATRVLRESKPVLLIEVAPGTFSGGRASFDALLDLLVTLGYQAIPVGGKNAIGIFSDAFQKRLSDTASFNCVFVPKN